MERITHFMFHKNLGAKIDNATWSRRKLGEIAYHQCKVPTQYKQIQAMPLSESNSFKKQKSYD